MSPVNADFTHEKNDYNYFPFMSFHFRLRFKGYVNKINHLLYTNKQYQYLLENYLAYFQYSNIKRKVK